MPEKPRRCDIYKFLHSSKRSFREARARPGAFFACCVLLPPTMERRAMPEKPQVCEIYQFLHSSKQSFREARTHPEPLFVRLVLLGASETWEA